jgi:DNA-binding transcriptional LysR family regulator
MSVGNGLEDSYLFWIIIKKGSYTKAAKELDIPKSQVSRRIVELERRLKKVLLIRNTRNINLTEIGSQYFNSIDSMMREWNAIQNKFQKENDSETPIRIALTSDIAAYFFPEVLRRFWKKFPEQKIEFFENRNIINLAEERMDLAIRMESTKSPGTIRRVLGSLRIKLYVSQKFKKQIQSKDIELGRVHSIGFHLPEAMQEKIPTNHLFKRVLKLPYRLKVSELSTALKYCIDGEGLLAIPDFLANDSLSRGLIFDPFPKDHLNFGPIEMISLEDRFLSKPILHLMREIENFSKDWFH